MENKIELELLGLPGCGKSTYAAQIVGDNQISNPLTKYIYRDSRFLQNFCKVQMFFSFILKNPKETITIMKFFRKITFVSKAKTVKMFLYLFGTLGVIASVNRQGEKSLMDEGICQVVWGMLYNSKPESRENVLALLPILKNYIAKEIVVLQVDKSIIVQRLLARQSVGGSELQHDLAKSTSVLDESQDYIDMIVEVVASFGMKISINAQEVQL